MTEFTSAVLKQKLILEAEEWARGVVQVHIFNTDNTQVGYDYPNPMRCGYVTDTTYNDGTILREVHSSGAKMMFGEKLQGEALLQKYLRS